MSDFASLLQAIFALCFVLCLIGLTAILLRRYMPLLTAKLTAPNRRLQILETLPLDARHRVILLRCDMTEHLLVVGEGGVSWGAATAAQPISAQQGEMTITTETTP
jgi:flagellar protein FliO/FliZ